MKNSFTGVEKFSFSLGGNVIEFRFVPSVSILFLHHTDGFFVKVFKRESFANFLREVWLRLLPDTNVLTVHTSRFRGGQTSPAGTGVLMPTDLRPRGRAIRADWLIFAARTRGVRLKH